MSQAQNISALNSQSPSGIAPTPQNTPAAHLSHSALSRPQVPSTLAEEVEEDDSPDTTAAGLAGLVNNPAFANLVNDRLATMVGRSSGYVESLSLPVRRRITGLKGLQVAQAEIEAEFQKDIYELEKRYADKYRPLFERRQELVSGRDEPNADEVEKGQQAEDEESEDEDEDEDEDDEEEREERERERETIPTAAQIAAAPKGIPEFWLTALKNHLGISDLITERDEEALKYLVDIRLEYPVEKPGFTLIFQFAPEAKAFFDNTQLEKTYYYQDDVGYQGDFVYDHAVGTDIKWVDGKDLTVRIETKKQRNKNTNQTRIVKKVIPTESFFTFFNPPKPPSEDDDEEDEDEDIDEKLEMDYQIGEDLKEKIIPRAIDYFTGKALRYEQGPGGDFDSEDDDEFDDDDEDDDDEDDSEDDAEGGERRVRKAPAPPVGNTPQDPQECKQS